jgi:hypothetical protein
MNPTDKIPKNPILLMCEFCLYKTVSKKDFAKHLATRKHENLTNPNMLIPKNPKKNYTCECNKTYKHLSSLCAHKKQCVIKEIVQITSHDNLQASNIFDYTNHNENIIISNNTTAHTNDINQLTNLVIEVVKNNSDFQKQMFEMCRNMQSSIITNCNNTTNNTTFNLQVFLNEYCKDAMNISEFIESFDLQISDLENVGRLGYIEGMSNIIISKINELEVNKRPIHCSDLKREIIYIKDDDVWGREDANNTKFRKVISKVTRKNIRMLSDWRDMYPDYMDIESENNEIYMNLIKEAMGPSDTADNETKIIKKVVKHVVIDKKMLLPNV